MNFASAASWLSLQRQACGAVAVIYRRGTSQALALRAKPEVVSVELMDGAGAMITAQRVDWTVEVDDLVFGGEYSTPAEGDQIEVVERDKKTRTYEAMPYGTQSHYEVLMDRAGYKIHTKMISES